MVYYRFGLIKFSFNNATFFQIQPGKKLRRSYSTGSGDKVQNNSEIASVSQSELTDVMETIPDIFNSLVISHCNTANNNTIPITKEDMLISEMEAEMIDETFDPSIFGMMEDPGVIRFDSLDYPDSDLSDMSSDEDEDIDETDAFESSPMSLSKLLFSKILRFSCDSLKSSVFRNKNLALNRSKSLPELSENL